MLSLKYAAPETVAALEAGQRGIVVDAAVDIWAIGVIAFELLAGERAFPTGSRNLAQVRACLAGRAPLPWERGSAGAPARLKKMRGLKRTVRPPPLPSLCCLARLYACTRLLAYALAVLALPRPLATHRPLTAAAMRLTRLCRLPARRCCATPDEASP
jgi:serine/threonine protein kinase